MSYPWATGERLKATELNNAIGTAISTANTAKATADAAAATANAAMPNTAAALAALVAGLPTTLPATAGQLWNNGGVLSIS